MFTLIVNYFVERKLISEIKEYPSPEEAMKRIRELQGLGIEITPWHYGIYQISLDKIVEVTPKKAS